MKTLHLHLVSDSTGETAELVARACTAQFKDLEMDEHLWNLVRKPKEVEAVLAGIEATPGFVLFTLVNEDVRNALEEGCRRLQVPHISILDPIVFALRAYVGSDVDPRPGRQHSMDDEYFGRIEAIQFALAHDDGQSAWNLNQADVVILGVSRTSKTPTCIYLANRGIKAANVPIIPGVTLPPEVEQLDRPLVVGLTKETNNLIQIRRNRLRLLNEDDKTDYVDPETVAEEVKAARRLFSNHGWEIIDVTRKSIEETAATIISLHSRRRENLS